jgi:hypothetical protein
MSDDYSSGAEDRIDITTHPHYRPNQGFLANAGQSHDLLECDRVGITIDELDKRANLRSPFSMASVLANIGLAASKAKEKMEQADSPTARTEPVAKENMEQADSPTAHTKPSNVVFDDEEASEPFRQSKTACTMEVHDVGTTWAPYNSSSDEEGVSELADDAPRDAIHCFNDWAPYPSSSDEEQSETVTTRNQELDSDGGSIKSKTVAGDT